MVESRANGRIRTYVESAATDRIRPFRDPLDDPKAPQAKSKVNRKAIIL